MIPLESSWCRGYMLLKIEKKGFKPYEAHIIESILNTAMFILKFKVLNLFYEKGFWEIIH